MGDERSPGNLQGPPAVSAGAGPTASQPPDPVPWIGSLILGLYFCTLAALTFYFLFASWPVSGAKDASGFADFSLFGSGPFSTSSDHRLFLTVMAAGALGSLIHSITSFADYAGNRSLSRSWIWWLVLRTPIGIALALLFYLVLRGGLIVPSLPNGSAATDTTRLLNPYGIAAISALAGMFSKQATDKLREIFDTLFRNSRAGKSGRSAHPNHTGGLQHRSSHAERGRFADAQRPGVGLSARLYCLNRSQAAQCTVGERHASRAHISGRRSRGEGRTGAYHTQPRSRRGRLRYVPRFGEWRVRPHAQREGFIGGAPANFATNVP